MTVSSGSVSRRTATTLMPQWFTGTTGLVVSGSWPSIREAKLKWAPARGSNPSMSPPTFCPGSACTTKVSEVSPSQTGAKTEGKLHHLRRPNLLWQRQMSMQEQPRDERRSSTGPSTGLDSYQRVRLCLGGIKIHRWWTNILVMDGPKETDDH